MKTPTISVVINTYNRSALLHKTIDALRYLDYENFEVIVVNGPSDDDTEEVVRYWVDHSFVKAVDCPVANLSMSRNIGIRAAAGEIVVFLDDDAIPEAEWLCQLCEAFDDEMVAAAGGKVYNHTGYVFQYEYANANRLGVGFWQEKQPSPQFCFPFSFVFPYLQGTNTAFRRSFLVDIGGFDENYIYYLDETDVCLRLIDRGYTIKQLPNAYVHHKYAPSHIRSNKVAKYRFPVLKSKIYFSNRHAKLYLSVLEIDEENVGFIHNHRTDVNNCVSAGLLTRQDAVDFEEQARRAWKEAKEAASALPLIMSPSENQMPAMQLFIKQKRADKFLTIVLLCEDYPPNLLGGIARFTQDKATALARMGHKVHVIARGEGFSTVDLEDGVWVHRVIVRPREMTQLAIKLGVPKTHWDQSDSFLEEICRIETHRAIDIVEAPIWNVLGISPLLSKKYPVVTSIMTTLKISLSSRTDLKDPEVYRNFVAPLIAIERYLLVQSDKILAISAAIGKEVEKTYDLSIPSERLFVSHLGMPDWRSGTARSEINSEAIRILFVGRLEKRKGIDVLLECIPQILDTYRNVELHVVGDDTIQIADISNTYRKQFENIGHQTSNRVIFHNKVSDQELRRHYASCDIFVAPSRFESFGLIFLEAMMFAKPVIGCLVGGIPEVVIDKVTGLLVPPEDVDALRNALFTLVADPGLRKQLGDKGRKLYEERFTDINMAKGSTILYHQVISDGKKSSIS